MGKREQRLGKLTADIQQLERRLAELRRHSDRLTTARLLTFLLAAVASGLVLLGTGAWQWLAATPLLFVPFALAVGRHRRVEAESKEASLLLKLRQIQAAKMRLDWAQIPAVDNSPAPAEHPFAADLDLIGERSIHQLMDTAVSIEGSLRLRNWLLHQQVDHDRIAQRQARIRELLELSAFRDGLFLNASRVTADPGEKWPGSRMLEWLRQQPDLPSLRPLLLWLTPLSVITITMGLLNAVGLLPPYWVAPWLLFIALSFTQARRLSPLFQEAFFLRDGLLRLSHLFNFLERSNYENTPLLEGLCRPFLVDEKPSAQLKRIGRVVAAAGLQRNPVLWMYLNAFIPWDIYFGYRLSQCQKALADLLPAWLDTWFELEALASLASFVDLNPEAAFPEILPVGSDAAPLFAADSLGHPLVPAEQRICNDITLEKLGTVYIITGSNLSGKSTFLRTVGANLALAYAGAPVIGGLRCTVFDLFTAIRVSDSVVDGFSYFYAEVRRLKSLLDRLQQSESAPLLYLIDEIFRGTNNKERLLGSREYLRALAGRHGIGFVATHDLELIQLADELPTVLNYHFRDAVADGRMIFDYKLHEGPCPTTNALRIMDLAGLPVPENR